MTTASWSTPVDHTTDAGFRAWGSELNSKFAAVGMVQTSDTGQINWTTVTLPATNTASGYEIWKLSSGNLYFKITYATGNATGLPDIQPQVGTGSSGSGTLTGTVSTNQSADNFSGQAISSITTNYQSYLCATADYVMLSWKIGGIGSVPTIASCFFTVMQTVDSTGAATSIGYLVYAGARAGGSWQSVATAAGSVGPAQSGNLASVTMVFGGVSGVIPASSQDGSGNNQAFLWWFSVLGHTPVTPMIHVATILDADLTLGNTASLTLVGTTAHTYIGASTFGHGLIINNPPQLGIKILALWE
jgi:hypothetical protein